MSQDFTNSEYWKAIILYGLNSATYKIALGKTLLELGKREENSVAWDTLAKEFLDRYIERLSKGEKLPQQSNPSRLTKIERLVNKLNSGKLNYSEAIDVVGKKGFKDVIPRFQTIGTNSEIVSEYFYSFDFGKKLILHDSLLSICESSIEEMESELEARWSLLEGAFLINHENWHLANDVRGIYLDNGYQRRNLTENIPFLQAYQGNRCFYCGEPISEDNIEVDHVLPRQVLQHDEEWNLVLSHSLCNSKKGDQLIGEHFIRKLIQRNENLIGSNHPWKNKIKASLGKTKAKRRSSLRNHYNNVKKVLGPNYWNGDSGYNPASDPFYKKLITVLNND